ncbi:MAG: N-6 DNA methylase [Candidatus Dojkabacteria bacterium]|nr:N-6 DNA methylase [Candidatus Dojkabacteria bacterium]
MLNGDTKRKIQGARDILVGKIPVPTAQVEQITLALMYKFMSDMDEQAKKLGDKTGFFIGEFEKYSWKNITDTTLSAYDRVALYSEGLEKMNNNPNVPQLFRDIFKGAFLPFKDPETLKLFLDQINEIEYTHSEDLGDAYEYLLSVMGSQGDAGQFRTPRHIIDFIVQVVDPKKEDRILDPACGTAGFLISAYKHILKQNTAKDSKVLGDNLSPMDRRNLTKNFVGYDISHEMRRLSLVNMYLHQFSDPQIYEYDTLTSTDHWDEDFDCILANPPFMTPKGGIRPHNRFSVKANRAEVLFVDYIMEHLSTTGKAGIIVPEGIIFQSSNAYKNLRKLLVDDNYLWGVISLPQGVFNPYAGVKTSVLLLDKNIAKKTDNILFVNVEGDGFDLGAQRKENGKNDLPEVLNSLKKYKEMVLNDKEIKEEELFNTNVVGKSRIKESGDYNLSGNRYKSSERNLYVKGKWEEANLGDICIIESGSREKGGSIDEGIPSIGGAQIDEFGGIKTNSMVYVSEPYYKNMKKGVLKKGDVLVVKDGATTGKTAYYEEQFKDAAVNEHVFILRAKDGLILSKYLFYIIKSENFQKKLKPYVKGMIGGISLDIKEIKIPLPPIEEQKKIVDELDRYQRIIDGARMVIDNWKPEIEIDPEWTSREMVNVANIIMGQSPPGSSYNKEGEGKPFYQGKSEFSTIYLMSPKTWTTDPKKSASQGDIVMSVRAPVGPVNLVREEICIGRGLAAIQSNQEVIDNMFLFYYLRTIEKNIKGNGGAVFDSISKANLENLEIKVPEMKKQKEIARKLEMEEGLVETLQEKIKEIKRRSRDYIKSKIYGEV